MEKYGNIIFESTIKSEVEKIYFINYHNEIVENSLPTLIIGWDFVKKIYPDVNLNILEKKINDTISWCYSPLENRSSFLISLKKFYERIIEKMEEEVEYKFISPFHFNEKTFKKWFEENLKTLNGIAYLDCSIFLYIKKNDNIFGYYIEDLEYFGISLNKIIKLLHREKYIILYNTDFLLNNIKEVIHNREYIVPKLYSLL